ncbi:hypothetical protein T190611E02C_10934 [Tenacibaculum sp. 190524A05c]
MILFKFFFFYRNGFNQTLFFYITIFINNYKTIRKALQIYKHFTVYTNKNKHLFLFFL